MWQTLKKQEIIEKLRTDEMQGLTEKQVKELQEKEGKNKLADKKKESILIKFIKQFNDFMIIILIIASIISALVSKMQGENDYIDSFIIIAIVIINAIMGVIQEAKAEKAIEALKQLTPQKCKTIRNGNIKEINAEELVKGDIVLLEAGNYVPADCRLLETYNLKIEESSLTGENLPSEKDANYICKKEEQLGDMKNMAFMASTIVNGHANENNSRKNSKYDDRKRSTRNTNPKKIRASRKNIRNSMFSNMHTNFLNRNNKKDRANRNVYDISRISSSSNTRRITSNSNNSAINRGNKNGKKEQHNKKITSSRNIRK